MPQDWFDQATTSGQPKVTPQPFPGAIPASGNPNRMRPLDNADQRLGIDYRAADRADHGMQNEDTHTSISVAEERRKAAAAEAAGGYQTTAEERKAAALSFRMARSAETIKEIQTKHPEALQPGMRETLGSLSSNAWVQDAAIPANVRSARMGLNNAYRDFVQNAIYAASGAAFNQNEMDNKIRNIMPSYWDTPETLDAKRKMIETEIGASLLQSGADAPKVEKALAAFRDQTKDIWTPKFSGTAAPKTELSGDTKTLPMDPKMQEEHQAWLTQHPVGTLTLADYLSMRQGLDKKYGGGDIDPKQAQAFVDAYNKGQASLTIPAAERELGGIEKFAATAAADKGVVGDLYTGGKNFTNAMTLGVPELLSGREGRRASDLADEAHPMSALAGDVAGSIAPVMGGEALALRGLEAAGVPLVTREGVARVGPRIGAEMIANGGYAGIRGANEAEPGERLSTGAIDAAIGAGAVPLARGLVKGAKGFMGVDTERALGEFGEKTFDMPPERKPLPVDDITPVEYQGLDDAGLRQRLEDAQRGISAHDAAAADHASRTHAYEAATSAESKGALTQKLTERKAAAQAEIEKSIGLNRQKQEQYIGEMSHLAGDDPRGMQALQELAEEKFPTDAASVEADVQRRLPHLFETPELPEPAQGPKPVAQPLSGVEDRELLQQRIDRLNSHLAQDPTPKTGTIPGVDLTTMQRAGLGKTEEALQGLPGLAGAREKAIAEQNKQNSARVLSKIGEELPKDVQPGYRMNAYVNSRLDDAYRQIRPQIKGRTDTDFNNAVAAMRHDAVANGKPGRTELWAEIEDALSKFRKPDGTFDGEGYKELSTQLRRLTEVWTRDNNSATAVATDEMARVAEKVRQQAQFLVSRANPAVGKRLKSLERAWAHQARIEAASGSASAAANRGVYAPDDYMAAIKRMSPAKRVGGTPTDFARGRAFDQGYAENARDVIGGRPANKASIKETAVGAASLHFGGAPAAAIVSGMGLGYVPGVKRLVQAIIDGKVGASADAIGAAIKGSGDSKLRNWASKPANADSVQNLITQLIRAEGSKKVEGK